jgi:general nucleoside transport system permease protein
MDDFVFIAQISIKSSVAVLFATLGEIITERSGILNLGVEGMMIVGALCGFAAGFATQNPYLAVLAGAMAGGLLSLIHAFFTIKLRSNQVLCGLALTILGIGLANFLGRPLIGEAGVRIRVAAVPYLSDIPYIGEIFFQQSPYAYAAYFITPLAWYILFKTRFGLILRAVGEDAASADAAGVNVAATRTAAIFIGGLFSGVAGSYLSLSYTPGWKETMTGGQGWIAIAMVIFCTWNPLRAFWGALLFGGLTALQFFFQATSMDIIPSYLLKMMPYLLTIAVLTLVTSSSRHRGSSSPADLGIPFIRER